MKELWNQHKIGILATIAFHLLLVFLLLLFKMSSLKDHYPSAIMLDFQTEKELEEIIERENKILEEARQFVSHEMVRNRPVNLADIDKSAYENQVREEIYGKDESNPYDQKFEELFQEEDFQVIDEDRLNKPITKNEEKDPVKYSGPTTVTYDLKGRQHRRLPLPIYKCQGGGTVEVTIWVDQKGYVVASSIAKTSVNDPCLQEAALKAANRSVFSANLNAPEKQKGKITYLFISQ